VQYGTIIIIDDIMIKLVYLLEYEMQLLFIISLQIIVSWKKLYLKIILNRIFINN